MICPNCGKEMNEGDLFCGECGYQIVNGNSNYQQANQQSYQNQYQQQYQNQYRNQYQSQYQNQYQNNYQQQNQFNYGGMGGVDMHFNNNRNVANNSVISYNSIEDVLVDPTENVIATYGNSYIQNFTVTKDASQFAFILTDKRVYFKGCGYQINGNNTLNKTSDEAILDLADITGTKFKHIAPFSIKTLITAIYFSAIGVILKLGYEYYSNSFVDNLGTAFLVAGAIIFVLTFMAYTLGMHTNFCIEYAGGELFANIKVFGIQSARDFNRQIRRAKDKICGK